MTQTVLVGSGRAVAPGAPIISLRQVTKTFGSTRALKAVDLELRSGEVLGVLGHNGSGKSTMVGVLTGHHRPDAGATAVLRGKPVDFPLPRREVGIGVVTQDLGLVETLNGLENLRIGTRLAPEGGDRFGINWRRERRAAEQAVASYGVRIDLGVPVAELPLLDRAVLAIVRCMEDLRSFGARDDRPGILILDEPTVYLPTSEQRFLFELVRAAAQRGTSVLIISHDMHVIRELSSRLVVLRDGVLVAERETATTSDDKIVELIVGAPLTAPAGVATSPAPDGLVTPDASVPAPPSAAYTVRGLRGGRVKDVALHVDAGEIVGVAGLLGSGVEELPYLLFGAQPAQAGEVTLESATLAAGELSPTRSVSERIGLVPADRKGNGLVASLTIRENMMLLVNSAFFSGGRMRYAEANRVAEEICREFDVRPVDARRPVGTLSGGNQQKVLLAKWRQIKPRVLLLHEPTQGVDVGARHVIHELVREMARAGTSVLWFAGDYEEMAEIADRVLVVAEGRVTGELTLQRLNAADITAAVVESAEPIKETSMNTQAVRNG